MNGLKVRDDLKQLVLVFANLIPRDDHKFLNWIEHGLSCWITQDGA